MLGSIPRWRTDSPSSNGRTLVFGTSNLGSSPRGEAIDIPTSILYDYAMTLSTQEIMMIHQAVSTVALENDWDDAKRQELFNEAVSEIIKSRTRISKKKRHRQ
jgi:hypothetical protein